MRLNLKTAILCAASNICASVESFIGAKPNAKNLIKNAAIGLILYLDEINALVIQLDVGRDMNFCIKLLNFLHAVKFILGRRLVDKQCGRLRGEKMMEISNKFLTVFNTINGRMG